MAGTANVHLHRPQTGVQLQSCNKTATVAPAFRESHWRVDFKWVFGLPFTLLLALFLVALSLFLATGRDNATGAISAMRDEIVTEPQLRGNLPSAAPGLFAFMEGPDFATAVYEDPGLLEKEIRAVPDYPPGMPPETQGEETAAAPGAGLRQMMNVYSTPAKLLNGGVHKTSGAALTVLLALLLATGIPYLLFSRRLGRLASFGTSMAVASWLPFMLLVLMDARVSQWIMESRQATGEEEAKRIMADVIQPLTDNVIGSAMSAYRVFAILAALSFAIGAAGYLGLRIRNR